jgi:hypothetical protein
MYLHENVNATNIDPPSEIYVENAPGDCPTKTLDPRRDGRGKRQGNVQDDPAARHHDEHHGENRMINVHVAPLHFPKLPILISPCEGYDFYQIRMQAEAMGPELTIHISRAQLENMRDQLNELFPPSSPEARRLADLAALFPADPRDFPGSIMPSLMAGEVTP